VYPTLKKRLAKATWESVLHATNCLASLSTTAKKEEKNNLINPVKKDINSIKSALSLIKLILNNKPEVTKVLLCTKALTGVGASIAFGNQPWKGTWALLVLLVKIKTQFKKKEKIKFSSIK